MADPFGELGTVAESDEENLKGARGWLGDGLDLLRQLTEAFDFLRDALQGSPTPINERVLATGTQLVLWSRYHYYQAVLVLMRGHRTDAYAHLRRGVEGAAFARRIRQHPELADVWMNARRSENHFKTYKEKFGTSKLFPASDKLLTRLHEVYETVNTFSHPSRAAVEGHVERNVHDDGGFTTTFKYHQFESGDPSDFLHSYLYITRANRWVLEVYQGVFPEAVEPQLSAWQLRLNTFDAAWSVRTQEWKHFLTGGEEVQDPVQAGIRRAIADDA